MIRRYDNPFAAKRGAKARVKRSRRKRLWVKQGGLCFWCKQHVPFKYATTDHIIPVSKGGRSTSANTVMACFPCNQKKGSKMEARHFEAADQREIERALERMAERAGRVAAESKGNREA